MAHTLECGYSYMAVVGFDAGDPFYDTLHGKLQVMTRMYVVDEEGFTVFLNSLNLLLLVELPAIQSRLLKAFYFRTLLLMHAL